MPKPRLMICALIASSWTLAAQLVGAAPVPSVHALSNVRIVVAPGQVVENGTVVIRDGVIEAAGAGLSAPADARVRDLAGKTIYPGLIEPYAELPWPEIEEDNVPKGGHSNPMVTPERLMAEHADDDSRFTRLRGAGFTSAVLAPEQGILRGQSVLVNLGDGGLSSNLLAESVAQNATLRSGSFGEGYPSSLMGAEALFRQSILDGRWYVDAHDAYRRNPAQRRPAFDRSLASLAPVVNGEQFLVAEADDAIASLRWAHLATELAPLDMVLVGHGHEYERLDAIVATGLPVLLPIDFPPAPIVGDEDDGTVTMASLRHHKHAPDNPRLLIEAGADVAFTSHGLSDPKKIHEHLATAIERGLDADKALAALTTTPAEMLGLSASVGTVEAGKMANLIVVDGELFTASPKIQTVWVDGTEYEIKVTKAPAVDPLGTWAVTIDAGPGGTMSVTVELTGSVEDLGGSIGTPAGSLPFESAVVSGDAVELELDGTPLGMPGTISFTMNVDGDSATGSGQAPPGPFTLKATRTAKPDSNQHADARRGDEVAR